MTICSWPHGSFFFSKEHQKEFISGGQGLFLLPGFCRTGKQKTQDRRKNGVSRSTEPAWDQMSGPDPKEGEKAHVKSERHIKEHKSNGRDLSKAAIKMLQNIPVARKRAESNNSICKHIHM